jgi:hypothetical protein
MSDTLTFAELEAQHVELLPARTVLSLMFSASGGRGGDNTSHGGSGGTAVAVNAGNINFGGDQSNIAVASANGGNSSIHHFHHHGQLHHAPTNTSSGGNGGLAIAVNAGNINFGGDQYNVAVASANGGGSRIR